MAKSIRQAYNARFKDYELKELFVSKFGVRLSGSRTKDFYMIDDLYIDRPYEQVRSFFGEFFESQQKGGSHYVSRYDDGEPATQIRALVKPFSIGGDSLCPMQDYIGCRVLNTLGCNTAFDTAVSARTDDGENALYILSMDMLKDGQKFVTASALPGLSRAPLTDTLEYFLDEERVGKDLQKLNISASPSAVQEFCESAIKQMIARKLILCDDDATPENMGFIKNADQTLGKFTAFDLEFSLSGRWISSQFLAEVVLSHPKSAKILEKLLHTANESLQSGVFENIVQTAVSMGLCVSSGFDFYGSQATSGAEYMSKLEGNILKLNEFVKDFPDAELSLKKMSDRFLSGYTPKFVSSSEQTKI